METGVVIAREHLRRRRSTLSEGRSTLSAGGSTFSAGRSTFSAGRSTLGARRSTSREAALSAQRGRRIDARGAPCREGGGGERNGREDACCGGEGRRVVGRDAEKQR